MEGGYGNFKPEYKNFPSQEYEALTLQKRINYKRLKSLKDVLIMVILHHLFFH